MSRSAVSVVATHVKPAKGFGGVAESVFNLCSAWASRGHEFRLCVSDASMDGHISAAEIGLPENVAVELYRAIIFRRWGFGPGAVPRILRSILSARAVYVSGIATWPTTVAALISMVLKRPLVIATRGGLMERLVALAKTDKPHKWLFYRWLTLPTLRYASFVHVTSELERQGVLVLLPEARCLVIPNGLELGLWRQLPAVRRNGLTLCYVGRISREKGINRFIGVWLANRRADERLIVVGEGQGAYGAQFAGLVERAGGAVEATGTLSRDGIIEVLARSDFLVLPSGIEDDDNRENFGNSVAESLACGRPVLVSKGLAWDDVEAEGIGLLFDKSDDSIAQAIARARALSPELYGAMCRAARRRAERDFDIEVTADRLWSVLAQMGESRP